MGLCGGEACGAEVRPLNVPSNRYFAAHNTYAFGFVINDASGTSRA